MRIEQLIAKHVWKATFQNRAVVGLLLGIGLLLEYAAFTGWATFRTQNDIRARYQQQARQDWLNNPDKHPHRMAHYGHFAFRPKSPLSLFDFGMESFLGSTVYLEAHKQNAVNFSEAGFSTGLLRFGEISLAMVLQVLLPLLIFFLGFGTIAADRENGTLKIILSQGISWRQLIMGKSVGLLAVTMTLFVPAMVVTALLWAVAQSGQITADATARLLLLVLTYATYLTIFCVLAVLVSAVSRTTKTALVSLIGGWLLLTIVLPRASQALGSYLYPAPSKGQFFADIQADVLKEGDSHNANDPHYKAIKDSLLTTYRIDSVAQLPFNYSGFVMAEGERISAGIYNQHLARLLTVYDQQNSFSKATAFVNPFMAIKNGSMALSGTDYASYVDFQQQAEQYRYDMAQKMNALQMEFISNQKPGPADKPAQIDHKHWEEIPQFVYQSPGIGLVLREEWLSLLVLACWLIGLGVVIRILAKTLTPL